MNFAPVIIFGYNRPESLKATVDSLLLNTEAAESDLYVFVDGARPEREGDCVKVRQVQEFVKGISGFKSVVCRFAEKNSGLGPSIIAGVTEVVGKYGIAIVLEDDLVLSSNFLSFMNQGLERYRDDSKVFSVCGYSNSVRRPEGYYADSYFCTRSSSWGWATWADRWNSVDWELEPFGQYLSMKGAFNRWGGSDCYGMLHDWHAGRNRSWAIRFSFSQFLQDRLSLFPMESKVMNNGFDGQGTNCRKWSRFRADADQSGKKEFVWPDKTGMNGKLHRNAMKYNSIPYRIYSRLMYLLHS